MQLIIRLRNTGPCAASVQFNRLIDGGVLTLEKNQNVFNQQTMAAYKKCGYR